MARELVNQAEYARRRGVSRQAVSKAIRSGRIKLVRGKIDTTLADAQWRANTDPAPEFGVKDVDEGPKAKEGLPPSSLSYTTSRAIREAYSARLTRLEYEEKVGELISADKVRLQAFNSARRARDLLLAIPDRVAPIVAGIPDQLECHRILLQEIHRVCDELSNAPPRD